MSLKIYLAAVADSKNNPSDQIIKIADFLKTTSVLVLSNIKSLASGSLSTQEVAQADSYGQILLDKIDAFIIDGTQSNSEAGHIIAYALFRKKHILYILPGGRQLDYALNLLTKRKESAPFFHVRRSAPQMLLRHAKDFMRLLSIEPKEAEIPSIKFTLRITPKIDHYLSWRASRSNVKKADFLREMIEGEVKKDDYYKKEREKER